LQTALALFSVEGYDNVGIQRIVDVVGVKKPTLYHYFGSKNGLLVALLNQHFVPFLQDLREIAVYRGDITLTLETIAQIYFRFASEHPKFYRFTLAMIPAPVESEVCKTILPIMEQQYTLLEEVFRQAEQDHGNMRGRSKLYALTFLGTLNAYITSSYYNLVTLTDKDAYIACKQYMHGIFS
jgi:TetR/AcrR family transcriptional regulator